MFIYLFDITINEHAIIIQKLRVRFLKIMYF